jgi:hypothetical protein
MARKATETALAAPPTTVDMYRIEAKLTKAQRRRVNEERERADSKEWWDRAERVGMAVLDKAALSIAGAILGYVTFLPTRFDFYQGHTLQEIPLRGPQFSHDEIRAEYAACQSTADTPERKAECERRRAAMSAATVVIGYRTQWRIFARVYVNLHTLVPNLVVDIQSQRVDLPWPLPDFDTPSIYWSLRETLAFDLSRDVWSEWRDTVDGGMYAEVSRRKAEEVCRRIVTRDLALMGAAGGFTGVLTLPEILKSVGEVLKGIGEIVPG